MSKKKIAQRLPFLLGIVAGAAGLVGCGGGTSDGKVEVELVSYKPEAVAAMEKIEERFNETHDDIRLKIDSPNEAMTILKTRFIREDYPDIVGIGGISTTQTSSTRVCSWTSRILRRSVW